ncbi:restriction endonuclease subunit S [Streptomyces flaveolus]|uniref:restriction endonuclease subunit S n=1 Tax=Streptomyces flaveolus TaxID=67297 RepID=UPI00342B35CC
MSEWKTVPLTDVLDFQEGPGIMARDFRDKGVPLLRLAGLKRNAPLLAGCNYLDPEAVAKRWGHFRLLKGDVLLSTSASLGEVAIVDDSAVGAIAYTGIIRFRPKNSTIDATFIEYMLQAPSFKQQIEAMGVGSVMKHFGPMHLRQMTVNAPLPRDQQAIAAVLGAVDEKIAVNERIAAAALELGGVKFQFLRRLANEEVVVGDLVELKYGKSLPAARRIAGDIPVFGSGGTSGSHNEPLVKGPGIIIGRKGTVGSVYWSEVDFFPIDTTFYVASKNSKASLEYMYFALRGLGLERMNSDSAVPGLNRDRAQSLSLRIPASDAMQEFTAEARNLFQLQRSCEEENHALAALRDTLLPQLMSGRLRVKDAEKIVEDHV